jgi:hypothetical protein
VIEPDISSATFRGAWVVVSALESDAVVCSVSLAVVVAGAVVLLHPNIAATNIATSKNTAMDLHAFIKKYLRLFFSGKFLFKLYPIPNFLNYSDGGSVSSVPTKKSTFSTRYAQNCYYYVQRLQFLVKIPKNAYQGLFLRNNCTELHKTIVSGIFSRDVIRLTGLYPIRRDRPLEKKATVNR